MPLPHEIVEALICYAGPLDDPRVGWCGHSPSHPDMFKCERCGEEHKDSTLIAHKLGCSASMLLNVLQRLNATRTDKGETK